MPLTMAPMVKQCPQMSIVQLLAAHVRPLLANRSQPDGAAPQQQEKAVAICCSQLNS